MAEVTSTRKELRRNIARTLHSEFFRRYADNEAVLSGIPTTLTLPCASLTQVENFWANGWLYVVDGTQVGKERRITNFAAATDILSLEYALPGAPAAGDKIEIHNIFSPADVHTAINRSIQDSGKLFFDTVQDSSLILQENKLVYSIANLARKVWRLNSIRVERTASTITGVIDSASSTAGTVTLVDAAAFVLNDQFNGQRISIYAGTGSSQQGVIVDTVAATKSITVATTSLPITPAAGSKYRIWNAAEERADRYAIIHARPDAAEFPDEFALNHNLPDLVGMRLYLTYDSLPIALTLDADATGIPQELIINQAIAYLHEGMMNDNRADSNRHANIAAQYREIANVLKATYSRRRYGATQWQEANTGFGRDIEDPLGWQP